MSADEVRPPPAAAHLGLWRRAAATIRRSPPAYRPCLLHRDFHPGNVLFRDSAAGPEVCGVVDWVENSWGPADLDVVHCATNLAFLHGPVAGLRFADQYAEAGGSLAADSADHLYWRLIDALAFVPAVADIARTWQGLGRTDLTPERLGNRLTTYVDMLMDRYGPPAAEH